MKEFIQQAQLLSSVNYANWGIGLLLLISYTLLFQFLFRKYAMVASNRTLFASNFLLFSVAIYLIITTIKSSLALSLGLVGALSIIRFRTAIKEPEQIIFLLGLTAISISLAAEQFIISTISAVVFSIIVITRYNTTYKKSDLQSDYLMIYFECSDNNQADRCIDEIMKNNSIYELANFEYSGNKNYRLLFKIQNASFDMIRVVNELLKQHKIQEPTVKLSSSNA